MCDERVMSLLCQGISADYVNLVTQMKTVTCKYTTFVMDTII